MTDTTAPTAASTAQRISALLRTPLVPPIEDGEDVGLWLGRALVQIDNVSSGERVIVRVAQAAYNGAGGATIDELTWLPTMERREIIAALSELWDATRP